MSSVIPFGANIPVDMALLAVVVTAPLFLVPAELIGIRDEPVRLPLHEAVLLVCAGAVVARWLGWHIWHGDKPREIFSGALAAMVAALIHGMVDNFYFVPDIAFAFWLLLALVETPRTENWTNSDRDVNALRGAGRRSQAREAVACDLRPMPGCVNRSSRPNTVSVRHRLRKSWPKHFEWLFQDFRSPIRKDIASTALARPPAHPRACPRTA